MNQLYPIIRRKRRPLVQENVEALKPDRLPPVAIVPLVAAVPVAAPVAPMTKRKKTNAGTTQN